VHGSQGNNMRDQSPQQNRKPAVGLQHWATPIACVGGSGFVAPE